MGCMVWLTHDLGAGCVPERPYDGNGIWLLLFFPENASKEEEQARPPPLPSPQSECNLPRSVVPVDTYQTHDTVRIVVVLLLICDMGR